MKKDTIVIGLGNPLMSDEGIGVVLIERLLQLAETYPHADFVDAGTGGMAVLHLLEGRSRAILIDCAYMATQPGTIRKFELSEVESIKTLAHQSLHEADIPGIIQIAKKLGQCPERVVFFGIEPKTVAPGMKLSEELSTRVDAYIETIRQTL